MAITANSLENMKGFFFLDGYLVVCERTLGGRTTFYAVRERKRGAGSMIYAVTATTATAITTSSLENMGTWSKNFYAVRERRHMEQVA